MENKNKITNKDIKIAKTFIEFGIVQDIENRDLYFKYINGEFRLCLIECKDSKFLILSEKLSGGVWEVINTTYVRKAHNNKLKTKIRNHILNMRYEIQTGERI